MPLLRFDTVSGRSPEAVLAVLDAAHDTGLGIPRTDDVVVLRVTGRQRGREQKERFCALLVRNLQERCGRSTTRGA